MAHRSFFSFHFSYDHWRAGQVRNMGVVEGNTPISSNDWEAIKKQGDGAITRWISDNMKNRGSVIVLVGEQTASRPWVDYEIRKGWDDGKKGVYPGFPTPFWGLSGFFVGDLIGKALWELVENAQRFPRHGGRVLCVHGAVSFHRARPCATRWLPGRGPMRDVELDRCVLGLQSTGEQLCSRQHRRPVHAERSIYPGKTGISGAYAIWETRI